MKIPDWMQDPRIQHISPAKLSLLVQLAEKLDGKSQKEAMPILMGAMASASRRQLQFTKEEFELMFEIMKEGKTDTEKQQMNEALSKAQRLMKQIKT